MSLARRIRKIVVWGTVLLFAVVAGGVGFAYLYVTDSDNVAAVIKQKATKFLPDSLLAVAKVQLRPIIGDITLNNISLQQRIDGRYFMAAQIPWLRIKHNPWDALHGKFVPTEVSVAQPTLRIKRRKDGTWNLQGLLADPWPGPPLPTQPVVLIKGGIVELLTEGDPTPAKILRDVEVTVEPTSSGTLHFDGSAQGDAFDRISLDGEIDRASGRVVLTKGSLTRLAISQTLLHRLPPEIREPIVANGVTSGEVDLTLKRLVLDPNASPKVTYDLIASLRGATWSCHKLPFPFDNVEAVATVRDGLVTIQNASGRNGKTRVRANGSLSLGDPAQCPLSLDVTVLDLELDRRLRSWTPPRFDPMWDQYKPQGWVDVQLHLARAEPGNPMRWGVTVFCRDVSMNYHLFPYPIEHAHGTIDWQGPRIRIDAETLVGGKLATVKGTVDNPGPMAQVNLDFTAESMPIDETLISALPPSTEEVVRHFHPSGSARGEAHLHRYPPEPNGDGKGKIDLAIDADLNEGCAMKWDGLPYPISNLTGHLAIRPDHWVFTRMKGENGPTRVSGKGKVDAKGQNKFAVDLDMVADNLSFDPQLREALPKEWRTTWATLNPSGSSKVEAKIVIVPGEREDYHLKIEPKPETRVQLELTPVPDSVLVGGGGGPIRLPPMEDVRGQFEYRNGVVTMNGVKFSFHEAPIDFRSGTVTLNPQTGAFALAVKDLEIKNLRLDADLRKVMPPLMQEFSRRLDDGKPFGARANLGIRWSGKPGQPAFVNWDQAIVVFNGNTVQAGLPMGQIQGEAQGVSGWSDGRSLEVAGILKLDSIDLLGQQVTKVETPVTVRQGWAVLESIQGDLLGGKIYGKAKISLDITPKYEVEIKLQKADLADYTKTLPGRQGLRGLVSAQAEFSGQGNDLHTLAGKGSAMVEEGDLGKLPWAFRLLKVTNLAPLSKTAFDSAHVDFLIQDGLTTLKPIKLVGDAVSLQGAGTIDPVGDMDVHLTVLYGRDERGHIPGLSDLAREVGGRLVAIQLKGPVANPKPMPQFLPDVVQRASLFRDRFGDRKTTRDRR